jgi:hypothetical protein
MYIRSLNKDLNQALKLEAVKMAATQPAKLHEVTRVPARMPPIPPEHRRDEYQ